METRSLTSLYALYNPFGLYGLGGANGPSFQPRQSDSASSGLSAIGASRSSSTSVSSLGQTLSAIGNLESAAQRLTQPGALAARSATSSAPGVVQASASEQTATGTYTVRVDQLAQGQVSTSAAQATPYSAIGSGGQTTLSFQFADGRQASLTLDGSDNTLKGLAAAVNRADLGISASVVSSSTGYQLRLEGQSGAKNAFTTSASGDTALAGFFGSGQALTRQAQDAKGTVDGVAFSAADNRQAAAAAGLTLDLRETGTARLAVADNKRQTQAIDDFVKAYNAVQSGLDRLGREYGGFALNAPFLRNNLTRALDGEDGNSTRLAEIGITRSANGSLAVDDRKLQAALEDDSARVSTLFSNDTNQGVAGRILAQVSEEGALSTERLLQNVAPSLGSSAQAGLGLQGSLVNSLFSQQQQLLDQYQRIGQLSVSLSSSSALLNGLQGNSPSSLNGLGLVGGLANPGSVNSLFSN